MSRDMSHLAVQPAEDPAGQARIGSSLDPVPTQPLPPSPAPRPGGPEERQRRAEALRRHQARSSIFSGAGEVAYLRAQLRVGAHLTSRLTSIQDPEEMARAVVAELHETFAFYLAAIQRLDEDGTLRLIASAGPLAEVMTEFLLVEQPIHEGVNGRVARTGATALVLDTRNDRDYISRDPETDPRSELSAPIFVDGTVWGVLNIEAVQPGAFGEADAVLVETIAGTLGTAIHRAGLVGDMERTLTSTLAALTSTLEAKDDYTFCHGEDVAELSERVAHRLRLSRQEIREVRYAAMLHDIGKIAVPTEILLKPAPLTEEEWKVMRTHASVGGDLVARIDAFAHLAPAVRSSHERWDGKGYPDGLAGEEIPLAARIIAVCDTYDAIVTDRPYRPARRPAEAAAELRRVAGSQLDPRVVGALLDELGLGRV